METQQPLTVAHAATYAMIQEGVLEQAKFQSKQRFRNIQQVVSSRITKLNMGQEIYGRLNS